MATTAWRKKMKKRRRKRRRRRREEDEREMTAKFAKLAAYEILSDERRGITTTGVEVSGG